MRCLYLFLLLLPVSLIAQNPLSPAQKLTDAHQPVSDMALRIVPPPGFTPAAEFVGFEQRASRSMLLISELGGSVHANLPKFSRESLMERGMFVQREDNFMNGLVPARFVETEQFAYGSKQVKYIYLFGNQQHCFLLTATFPKDMADLGPMIKSSMLSAIPTTAP